jgi:DNA (cytosine-5)-methyltransferase 1
MGPSVVRALDLFAGAGGATRGLQQAGFHVTGVDIEPQPHYCGDDFIQADALATPLDVLRRFDFIWASPPCQGFTALRHAPGTKTHPDLITPNRELLRRSGKPYVIENVPGAPLIDPVTLCGSMFGLVAPGGAGLQRHRLFETSFPLTPPGLCQHTWLTLGVYGAHVRDRRRPAGKHHRPGSNLPREHAYIAFGVPLGSMTLAELSEAIPPAYSRYVAEAFLRTVVNAEPILAASAPMTLTASERRKQLADEKRERRAMREAELGERQRALPGRRYGVILGDPPWRFDVCSRETGMDRAADNHYPTSTHAEIKALDVASIAAPDCVLFLWATVPMLPQALDVMAGGASPINRASLG